MGIEYELRKVATVMAEGKQVFCSNEERLNADILVSQTVMKEWKTWATSKRYISPSKRL